jgi:hypothetical protein
MFLRLFESEAEMDTDLKLRLFVPWTMRFAMRATYRHLRDTSRTDSKPAKCSKTDVVRDLLRQTGISRYCRNGCPDHIFRTKHPERELMESAGPDLMCRKESRPYQDGIA